MISVPNFCKDPKTGSAMKENMSGNMNQSNNSEYILLIEDSEADINLVLCVLELKNFKGELKSYYYGRKALQFLAEESIQLPKVIIMDLGLPDISGLGLLAELKKMEKLSDIPIVIWSGEISPIEKAKCEELGAVNFLTKPIELDELEKQVDWILDTWIK